MNSLMMTVNGTQYVFECHSYEKVVEIIASHHKLWETMETKPVVTDIRWA